MSLFVALIALLLAAAALAVTLFMQRKQAVVNRKLETIYDELKQHARTIKDLQQRRRQTPAPEAEEEVEDTVELYTRPKPRPSVPKPAAQAEPPAREQQSSETEEDEGSSLWQDVLFLAQQGVSADKICRDLNITRGEVDLILSLQNFDPGKKN